MTLRWKSIKAKVIVGVATTVISGGILGGIAWARNVDTAITTLETSTADVKERLDRIETKLDLLRSEVRHGGHPY